MTEDILMNIHTTGCYKYGSLGRIYRQTSRIEALSLSLSLIDLITFRFSSGPFCVTFYKYKKNLVRVIHHDKNKPN